MPTLFEKIEADAARRLPLPANREPAQELVRYKNFLKWENHRLQMLHRSGASGRELCQARAAVLDVLLRYIIGAVQKNIASLAPAKALQFSLVAIGGYGRGELNPHSDIDIMFLHDGTLISRGKPHPYLTALTDGLLYTLWDIGLKVGHSVRTIEDCVAIANKDMQSKTSLIEARLVAGDPDLFVEMQAVVLGKCVKGYEQAYIAARIEDQETRRSKYGNSATMQEPNIKNGCGGLRDYQNLLWMAWFKYRARTLDELEHRGLINETERKQLEGAYDYLLRVRNELHYQAKRAVDVLPKNLQPSIAWNLGFTDKSPSKRLERFMKAVYSHMRNIYLITRTLEQRLALLPVPQRLPSLRDIIRRGRQRALEQLIDGFKIIDGTIRPATPKVFADQPRRLMRVFLYAQQRGVALNPDLAQMIRQHISLVNREFLKDRHVHETFLEILNQRGNVAPILRKMHEVGLLGKYMPEFGRLTCLVQHEFYHQYTADEHTLVCVEKLDQVWEAKDPPFSHYAGMFQSLERPFVLYLALLLHDAGKALHTGNHAETGGELALNVAKRLGLDGATTHSLRLVIESHLLMAQTSQRRDLDDPVVIRNFASAMQTRENLVLLTLHTFADSQGTSDQLWNGFKDTLLRTLYQKTLRVLSGEADFLRVEEKQIELLRDEVTAVLPPTFSPDEIAAHFENLPPRYFHIHTAKQIAADVAMVHRFMHYQIAEEERALEPVLTWKQEADRGYSSVHICTWDRARLFSKIAGSLTAAGLNILSAQIFTRMDGIILDTFFVTDARSGGLPKKDEKDKFEQILIEALKTEQLDFHALIPRQRVVSRMYQAVEGEKLPTRIKFDNQSSETATVIDVETEDRVGLLYSISQALADAGLNITLAKIGTEKGAAMDTFYVVDEFGQKIANDEYLRYVESKIQDEIHSLDRL